MRVQGLSEGVTTVIVTAPGYGGQSARISVTPGRGFSFRSEGFSVAESADPFALFVDLYRLDESDNRVGLPQELRAGAAPITVTLTNSDNNVGTLTEPYVELHGGSSGDTTDFDPASAGTTIIDLSQPPGFTDPAEGSTSIEGIVRPPPEIFVGDVQVGQDLQTWITAEFSHAPIWPTDVTVTVDDASTALLATSGDQVGTGSITLEGVSGTTTPEFAVQGLAAGTTMLTVLAPGWPEATATITVTGSGSILPLGDVGLAPGVRDRPTQSQWSHHYV